jgi:altronate hydrolase
MSLLDIAKLPTAENSAIHLHATDNVAVARVPLAEGQDLKVGDVAFQVKNAVPAGHKVALQNIAQGEIIYR